MAWVSAVIGALGGLVLALAAGFLGGWPVWLILLLYPAAAALLMLVSLAWLFWRSTRPEHAEKNPGGKNSTASGMPRHLGSGPF